MSNAVRVGGDVSVLFYTTPGGEAVCARFVPLHVLHTWTRRRVCGAVCTTCRMEYIARIQASAN